MRILKAYTWAIILFLWSPLVFVLCRGFSIEAFTRLFDNSDILRSLYQSLALASVTCLLTTMLGTLAAFALPHLKPTTRRILESSILLPLLLPEIAFGLAYLVWYNAIGLSLGWTTLLLSHIAFTFCYATLILRGAVQTIDWSLLDAARDFGTNPWQSFRHAIFPQLLPSIIASMTLCFSLSLDDFLISYFVKGMDQVTLPIKIFSMMRLRIGPEIYALSIVLFTISVASVLLSRIWQKNS